MSDAAIPAPRDEVAPPARLGILLRDPGAWFIRNFMAERSRWPLWLPAFIGAGIGAYFWLTFEPPTWCAPTALALGFAAIILLWRRSGPSARLAPRSRFPPSASALPWRSSRPGWSRRR